jgi:hypothetical protein
VSSKTGWKRRARILVAQVNFAWWLQYFLPVLFACSIAGAGLLLYLRKAELSTWYFWIAFASLVLLCALICVRLSRKKFFRLEDALVRLELHYALDSRLTAAEDGHTKWPRLLDKEEQPVSYRHVRIAAPAIMSLLVLILAAKIPVTRLPDAVDLAPEKPLSWQQIEELIETLEEEEVVEEDVLEELNKQIEEFQKLPQDKWYDHSAMEGADDLHRRLEKGMESLQNNLKQAEKLMKELQQFEDLNAPGAGNTVEKEMVEKALEDVLKELQKGDLSIEKNIMKQLENLSKGKALSPEQQKQLSERLQKNAEKLAEALRQKGAGSKSGQQKEGDGNKGESGQQGRGDQQGEKGEKGQQQGEGQSGQQGQQEGEGQSEGQGQGQGEGQGQQNGSGGQEQGKPGVARGPGSVPLSFGDLSRFHGSDEFEVLTSPEDPEGDPGELLGLTDHEPEARDDLKGQTQSGGKTASKGEGGDVVWKLHVEPKEQKFLEKYFE